MADLFNYDGVQTCMGTLDQKFSEFADLLKKANDFVNENIHVSHDSALYGELGKKMLDSWNENASTFSDFYENFNSWSQLMASIANSYGSFENGAVKNAIGQNQSSGATLKGVAETRAAISYNTQLNDDMEALDKSLGKEYKVIEQGVQNKEDLGNGQVRYTYIDGSVVTYSMKNNEVNKMVVEKADGTIETKYKLSDGGSVVEKYDTTGKPVSSDIVDPKGNVIMTREYTGKYENEKITYYDKNGKVVDTVVVEGRGIFDNQGVKNVATSDMYTLMSRNGKLEVSSSDLARETAWAAVDNNLYDGRMIRSYDNLTLMDKSETPSGKDAQYVQSRVEAKTDNAPVVYEKIDIDKFKEENDYNGVNAGSAPSGYNGGSTGYNPNGNSGGTTQGNGNGTGGYNAQNLPYNSNDGTRTTTLEYNQDDSTEARYC